VRQGIESESVRGSLDSSASTEPAENGAGDLRLNHGFRKASATVAVRDSSTDREAGERGAKINSFALVSYLPDPLASFLNHLRHYFAADCMARAHITVLPPRPLTVGPDAVWPLTKTLLQDFPSFPIELGGVELFPATQVIYIAVTLGHSELVAMHDRLNAGETSFDEPFDYHPHITLAQDLDPSTIDEALAYARRRWNDCDHSRRYMIDRLTFVQNTLDNRWTDLDSLDLSTHAVR
jgi:2'-5' RNA ligase